ncbi:hypothetical protein KJY73_11365 [Bowmanella sp. Y26]|uniref:hypothetical protein n=1 Tax=Bowmanella yangjiangensis TaxID=2811230 RepID=UPI001BDD98B6|nr:hypothetical protein [Bowmanella yangjiangensis]MBT1064178.1 hypothetical protein [Bowmanella yangjiangensis]
MNNWRWPMCWGVVLLLMLVSLSLTLPRTEFRADLRQLLPSGSVDPLMQQVAGQYQQQALLLLSHSDSQTLTRALPILRDKIAGLEGVSGSATDPSKGLDIATLVNVFGRFPLSLLSAEAEHARLNDNYDYIVERYFTVLSQPGNPLVGLTIGSAPLLNLVDWFPRVQGKWRQDGEYWYLQGEQRYYGLFLQLDEQALNVKQAPWLVEQLDVLLTNLPADTQVLRSGMLFHTAVASSRASFEMQLFGGMSLLGVVLLTLLMFRRITPLLLTTVLIGSSLLAGFAALLLVFQQVQLLALVFAVSLIGIAVDYAYHLLCLARYTGERGRALVKHLTPALLTSAVTTAISYLLLTLLPIDLLKQVGVFVAAGLAFALLTALLLLAWLPLHFPPQTAKSKPGSALACRSLLALMLVAAISGAWQLRFADDVRLFNSSPAWLLQNEQQVASLSGYTQYPRLLSVEADNEEQLLQRFAAIRHAFSAVGLDPQALSGLDQWLPSMAQQSQNASWLREGLVQGQLDDISSYWQEGALQQLLDAPDAGLTLALLPEALRRAYPPVLHNGHHWTGVLRFAGSLDKQQLEAVNQKLDFPLQLHDEPALISASLKQLRLYLMEFLLAALLCIGLLLSWRYGVKRGALMVGICALVTGNALIIGQRWLGYASLFNLLACVLIVALLVDYLVFITEHGDSGHVRQALLMSSLTSMLAFGMMVFSQTPAIYQFGFTLLVGLSLGWLVCRLLPAAWIRNINEPL